jgi:hypothetical protein
MFEGNWSLSTLLWRCSEASGTCSRRDNGLRSLAVPVPPSFSPRLGCPGPLDFGNCSVPFQEFVPLRLTWSFSVDCNQTPWWYKDVFPVLSRFKCSTNVFQEGWTNIRTVLQLVVMTVTAFVLPLAYWVVWWHWRAVGLLGPMLGIAHVTSS